MIYNVGKTFDSYDEFQKACAHDLGHLEGYNPLELPWDTRVFAALEFRCPFCGGRARDTAAVALIDGVPVTDMDAGMGTERLVTCRDGHDFVVMQCGTRFAFRDARNWDDDLEDVREPRTLQDAV